MPNIDLGQVMGPTGAAAGFGTVSATVDGNTGTPAVTVTASGPDTAKEFAFAFSNLKGATGATGETGPNEVSTSTATALTGVLAGNGSSVETLSTGAYTLAEIGQAIQDAAANPNSTGFAPNGYGLGVSGGKVLTSANDLNTVVKPGFYSWLYSSPPSNYPSLISARNSSMIVLSVSASYIIQRVNLYYSTYVGPRELIRVCNSGTWSDWEWVNPPLELDTEYLTTERYNGKPVYVKVVKLDSAEADTLKTVPVSTNGDMPVDVKAIITDSSGAKYCTVYATFLKYLRLAVTALNSVAVIFQSTSALSYPIYFICKYTKT